ncbi:hypothetical protein PS3A_11230 [Pseudomonas sp. 3A(2025)]
MAFAFRLSAAQTVQWTALLAAFAGVLVWSSVFLTPAQSRTPSTENTAALARSDNPALQWFSSQPAAVDIKVSGVMAAGRGSVAILSLNDGPPRSFLVGERLSQGVRLVAIEADTVVIERGTQRSRLNIGTLPQAPELPRLTRP